MTDLKKIEVQIKTGPEGADRHTRIFLGFKIKNDPTPPSPYIRAREFRLRRGSDANPFRQVPQKP
jgi:hypothetical protein